MSQLTLLVDYAKSFKAGIPCPTQQPVTIEVDVEKLPQAARDAIAAHLDQKGNVVKTRLVESTDEPYLMTGNDRTGPTYVIADTPTEIGLLNAIRTNDAILAFQLAERRAAAAARKQKRADATRKVVAERLTKTYKQSYRLDGGEATNSTEAYAFAEKAVPDWPPYSLWDEEVANSPEVAAWKAELDAANAARRNAAIAAEKAAVERAVRERSEWVARHGSRKLQRMVAEDIDHQKTYERERAKYDMDQLLVALATERPGWSLVDEADIGEPQNVTDTAFAMLDAARVVAPKCRLGIYKGRPVAVEVWRGRAIYWPRD